MKICISPQPDNIVHAETTVYTHTHTHIHTYACTRTHTHTHTHTHRVYRLLGQKTVLLREEKYLELGFEGESSGASDILGEIVYLDHFAGCSDVSQTKTSLHSGKICGLTWISEDHVLTTGLNGHCVSLTCVLYFCGTAVKCILVFRYEVKMHGSTSLLNSLLCSQKAKVTLSNF